MNQIEWIAQTNDLEQICAGYNPLVLLLIRHPQK